MEGHFTGSFANLFNYWQDPQRAHKFRNGGTRDGALRYFLSKTEVEIHKGVWVDTAVGAGYVQSQIYQSVLPNFMIGVDFSRSMLDLVKEPVERILGSAFQLPLRNNAANLASNIFCLSDYPDPSKAMDELCRILQERGVLVFLDYSDKDGYWKLRKKHHDPNKVIGNINLRNTKTILQYLPKNLRIVENMLIEYEVETESFDKRLELPEKLDRAFLYVEMYKSRS